MVEVRELVIEVKAILKSMARDKGPRSDQGSHVSGCTLEGGVQKKVSWRRTEERT